MEEDPYASIIKDCQIISSQEEELQKCRFAFEPLEEESSPPCPVQSTGIIMLSVPESNEGYQEEDVFHSPPENHRSQPMSNQGPEFRPENPRVVHQKDIGGRDEEVRMDGCFEDAEINVDLGKDSDTFGFSEPKDSNEIGGNDIVADIDLSKEETFQHNLKRTDVLESDCAQIVLDKCEVSNDVLGYTEQIVIESDSTEIGETEVIDLVSEEICKEMGTTVIENTEDVDERVTDANLRGLSSSRNIDDLDAFRYVSNGGFEKSGLKKSVLGKHGLHNSNQGLEENEGLFVKEEKSFKDLLNAARIGFDDITDTDYLKTAKECSLRFLQPRWWPPEGFDDQVVD